MIKNDRQFRILKAREVRLSRLLQSLEADSDEADERWARLKIATVRGEVGRLRADLDEYEALKAGRTPIGGASRLDDVARLLIRARIARGLTQAGLAERLGLKEQQIQRYEANDYASASLTRLREVARELDVDLGGEFDPRRDSSTGSLIKALETAGLMREVVQQRIAPKAIGAGVEDGITFLNLAARVGRIFGSGLPDDFGNAISAAASVAAFKTSGAAKVPRLEAYAAYAHYLAVQTLSATGTLPQRQLPTTAEELRSTILELGDLNFPNALATCWELGLPVLPLADPGAFHAAYWRHGGRGVIVLKQVRRLPALWLFDLLHEIKHAIELPEVDERVAIEINPTDHERLDSPEEVAANDFAADVIFGDRESRLFELVWEKSGGRVGLLKRAVSLVARKHDVDEGALAYFVAFRLSRRGIDWWGTATSMQTTLPDPWRIARDLYLERVRLDELDSVDRDLVLRALVDSRETVQLPAEEG